MPTCGTALEPTHPIAVRPMPGHGALKRNVRAC